MPAEDGRDEAVLEGGEQVLRGCRVAVAGVSAVPRAAGNVSDLQGLGDAGFEPPSLPPTAPTSAPRPRAPGLCRTGVGWGGGDPGLGRCPLRPLHPSLQPHAQPPPGRPARAQPRTQPGSVQPHPRAPQPQPDRTRRHRAPALPFPGPVRRDPFPVRPDPA